MSLLLDTTHTLAQWWNVWESNCCHLSNCCMHVTLSDPLASTWPCPIPWWAYLCHRNVDLAMHHGKNMFTRAISLIHKHTYLQAVVHSPGSCGSMSVTHTHVQIYTLVWVIKLRRPWAHGKESWLRQCICVRVPSFTCCILITGGPDDLDSRNPLVNCALDGMTKTDVVSWWKAFQILSWSLLKACLMASKPFCLSKEGLTLTIIIIWWWQP